MIGGTTTLEELISSCTESRVAELDDAELAALAGALLEVWPRLEAARLRVLAAVGEREAYREDGARDAVSWLAWRGGERRSVARQELELAAAVVAMPVVETGLAAGVLSKAKAAELGRAAGADATEQSALVAAAMGQTVEEVARAVDRWELEHHTTAEEPPMSLRFTPTAAGTRMDATLDTEGAEWVQVAVDAAADQLGLRELPWAERRGEGARSGLPPLPRPRRRTHAAPRPADGGGHRRARCAGSSDRRVGALGLGCLPAGRRGSSPGLRRRCRAPADGPGLDAAGRRPAHPQHRSRPGPRRDPP